MARRKKFGQLTERSQDRIEADASRYGLTRRQARERYNRGTYNPLAKDPLKRVPERAPFYPLEVGAELKQAAIANYDRVFGDEFDYEVAGRDRVLDAIENHASEQALRRMAGASESELRHWGASQKRYSYKYSKRSRVPGMAGKRQMTPEWLRSLGFDQDGDWHNVFWYH